MESNDSCAGFQIAVIGMALRFPGARNSGEYWRNLEESREEIRFFSDEELISAGVPQQWLADSNYVKAAPTLENIDKFDASFFGFTPREATFLDPQQRIFLECSWEAVEDAGYDAELFPGLIGVFAGAGMSHYLLLNILSGRAPAPAKDMLQILLGNDKDYLTTRVSYKLNLRGPSVAVQTACSTSLVAVHLACESLLSYQCDMALAGGVSIRVPHHVGYFYQDDMIFSPDGHCRTFDAKAQGTIFGSGCGVVVLKRLSDALKNGDRIDAVIRGSAINNDGSAKIGYTAPSIESQADVIVAAQAVAGVTADTINAIEAHGTATQLGDPIEVSALNRAFSASAGKENYCAIGSVKSNFGHLDNAAGIAGLLKMVLALKHRALPASLHFESPNPQINLAKSPFYVNTTFRDWPANGVPRRAGVSSFGIGGTNAHVILEEALDTPSSRPSRPWQVLPLSAKSEAALEAATVKLGEFLSQHPDVNLADVAFTLQVGRHAFPFRRVVISNNPEDGGEAIRQLSPQRVFANQQPARERPVAFLFSGQGAQYSNMGIELYRSEAVFREQIDLCCEVLLSILGFDLREALYPQEQDQEQAAQRLTQTSIAQPALFTTEYALVKLLESWGIRSTCMIGHSIGEYVAACLSGVFSLKDALQLVSTRGQLMQQLPKGAMLSVPMAAHDLQPFLGNDLSLAATNAPALSVVSGQEDAVAALEQRLQAMAISSRRLHTSHAFHSLMMDPILGAFRKHMSQTSLREPVRPYLSNVTGQWIKASEATDPSYWVRHLRETVRFGEGVAELLKDPDLVLCEIGPGNTLCTLARQQGHENRILLSAMRRPDERQSDIQTLLTCIGRLWLSGADVDWQSFHAGEQRHRVSLPTYPFERKRYWIEPIANGDYASLDFSEPADVATLAPLCERPRIKGAYVAPQNEAEEKLAEIWGKLLGIDQVGIHDGFFELGGHSLVATEMRARITETFKVQVPLNQLLESPTIAGMAALIEECQSKKQVQEAAPVVLPSVETDLEHRNDPFPLSEMQQAQWIGRIGAFNLGNVAAHVYLEAEGKGLDCGRLQDAWRRLIARHEMLRAIVRPEGQQQILRDLPEYEISVLDLRGHAPEVVEAQLSAIRSTMSHEVRPADRWPLFGLRLSELDSDRVRLHLSYDLIIGDIASMRILLKEWGWLYQHPTGDLPPLQLSYRDYVLAEERLKESDVYRRSLEYWQQRIASLAPAPDLPLAMDQSLLTHPKFSRKYAWLEWEAWLRMKRWASQRGLSPSSLLLAAFAEILTAWSRNSKFCINTTIINRLPLHPEVRQIVGEFASFAPLEVDNTARSSLEDLARQIQRQSWEDLENRYVSGVRILRELARVHGAAAGAVMPIVFTSTLVHDTEGEEYFPMAWLGEIVHLISQTPQVWLDHAVAEDERGLFLNWSVVEELFPEGMVEEMFTAYVGLVRRLAEDEQAWSRCPQDLLPLRQKQGLASYNATAWECPERLLHASFFEQAEQHPERVALVSRERQLSYGELAHKSRQIAAWLRQAGAQPNQLVGVVMDKGWEQIVAVLGIVASGAAYLPVDPSLPPERIESLLGHGEVRLALTRAGQQETWQWPDGVQRLVIGEQELANLPAGEATAWRQQQPSDLAYVIYTSGSTGQPKGVMMSHRATWNTIADINQRFAIGEQDAVLGISSLSFDLSVYDIFGVLGAGGRLVLPESAAARDPGRWLELIDSAKVTLWNTVPALMEMLIEYAAGRGQQLGLRLVMMSGDWIPLTLPARIRARAPQVEMISMGGATEAAIWSIWHPIAELEPGWESIPYGRPLRNQRFYVLNQGMEDCPEWVPGQLYIGGVGLAEGYWRDEEKTRSSFVRHPRSGERLYRTGDWGRMRPEGHIEFLGREDSQVKVHGHRIELGEIEAALSQHPAVQAAVVTASGERTHRRLNAYLVPTPPDTTIDIEEVKRFAHQKLPGYMVPVDIIQLRALPLSANGKVDRRALPLFERSKTKHENPAPSGDLVEKLAGIFAGVLGVEKVSVNENFFQMGGDSILGMRAIARANEQGVRITPEQLFEKQTIAGLATVVKKVGETADQETLSGKVVLSPIQSWLLEQNAKAAEVTALDSTAVLDPTLLQEAFNYILEHHDALRMRFDHEGSGWLQTYGKTDSQVSLMIVDLSSIDSSEHERSLSAVKEDLQAGLNLSAGPTTKMALIHFGHGRPDRILWAASSLIVDEMSWSILAEDLATSYQQLERTETIKLAAKTAPFTQWTEYLHKAAVSNEFEFERAKYLGMEAPHAPASTDAMEKGPASDLQITTTAITEGQMRAVLDEVPKVYNNHPAEILLASLFKAIATTDNSPVIVTIEDQSRAGVSHNLDVSRTVGCFTCRYPVLLNPHGIGPLDLLIVVKEETRKAARGATAFGSLTYLTGREKKMHDLLSSSCPLFSYSRVENAGGAFFAIADRSRSPILGTSLARCEAIVCGRSIRVDWIADSNKMPPQRIEQFSELFAEAVNRIVAESVTAEPGFTPSDFPEASLTQDELESFLTIFEKTGTD